MCIFVTAKQTKKSPKRLKKGKILPWATDTDIDKMVLAMKGKKATR